MSKHVFSKNPIFCSSHFRRELLHVGGALARRRRQGLRPGPGARPADQLRSREIVLWTRLVSLNEEESPPMKNPLLKNSFLWGISVELVHPQNASSVKFTTRLYCVADFLKHYGIF